MNKQEENTIKEIKKLLLEYSAENKIYIKIKSDKKSSNSGKWFIISKEQLICLYNSFF